MLGRGGSWDLALLDAKQDSCAMRLSAPALLAAVEEVADETLVQGMGAAELSNGYPRSV